MGSDKPRGVQRKGAEPDNQQERLIDPNWVTGFVDGEGCFSIGLIRQPDRPGRRGYKTGFQVSHEFAVTQGAKSVSVLHELQRFFAVGGVIPNRRNDDHREHLYRFVVRRRVDLRNVIIPFFRDYPLRTAKKTDFEKFIQCLEIIGAGRHRTRDGLIAVLEIAQTMNRQKPRIEEIRILRGHTSDIRDNG